MTQERCPLSLMSQVGCRRCTREAGHEGECEFKPKPVASQGEATPMPELPHEGKTPDTPESLALWVWDKFVGCPITEPYDAMYLLLLERLKFIHRATFTAGLHECLRQVKESEEGRKRVAEARGERERGTPDAQPDDLTRALNLKHWPNRPDAEDMALMLEGLLLEPYGGAHCILCGGRINCADCRPSVPTGHNPDCKVPEILYFYLPGHGADGWERGKKS